MSGSCSRPAGMRWAAVTGLFISLMVLSSGCAILHPHTPPPDRLSTEARDLSEALARYAHGLICQREDGTPSAVALSQFEQASLLDPGRKRLYGMLVRIYHDQGQLDKAIEVLQQACKENPGWPSTRKSLGLLYEAQGQPDAAIREFHHAMKLDPDDTETLFRLAALYFEQKQDADAIRMLEQAHRTAEDPSRVLTYAYWWGRKLIDDKESRRSIPCLEFVVEHYPEERGEFYHILGNLYETLKHMDAALRNYRKATEETPPYAPSFLRLSELAYDKRPGKAIEILRRGALAFPDNNDILFRLANLLMLEKRFTEAVPLLDGVARNVQADPENSLTLAFYIQHGAACEQAQLFEKAESIFEACLNAYPDAHEALNYLAYMWAERGENLKQALAYVSRALELDPDNGAYIDTLGWIYYKRKQFSKALTAIEKARNLMQDDPVIHDHLGDIHMAMANRDAAVEAWKTSFKLDPDAAQVTTKLRSAGVDIRLLQKEARRLKREAASQETQ